MNGVVSMTFVSMCFHHQAFYEMFQHTLNELNFIDENRDDKEFLSKIVKFQIQIRK